MADAKRVRRTLRDFKCAHDSSGRGCGGDKCGWAASCPNVDVYREYLALQRCARLLGIFHRWWHIIAQWRFRGEIAKKRRFRLYIRSALDKAGLL